MLTLYGCYRSRATRPLWALFETGMAFTHHPTIQAYRLPDPAAADAPANTASPDFLKVNPMGQIPAMVDGDLVLTESLAITLHVVRRAGGPIAPANDAETALMEQWALFASTAIDGPIFPPAPNNKISPSILRRSFTNASDGERISFSNNKSSFITNSYS